MSFQTIRQAILSHTRDFEAAQWETRVTQKENEKTPNLAPNDEWKDNKKQSKSTVAGDRTERQLMEWGIDWQNTFFHFVAGTVTWMVCCCTTQPIEWSLLDWLSHKHLLHNSLTCLGFSFCHRSTVLKKRIGKTMWLRFGTVTDSTVTKQWQSGMKNIYCFYHRCCQVWCHFLFYFSSCVVGLFINERHSRMVEDQLKTLTNMVL